MSRKYVDYHYEFIYSLSLLITAIVFREGCKNIYMLKIIVITYKNNCVFKRPNKPRNKISVQSEYFSFIHLILPFFFPFLH